MTARGPLPPLHGPLRLRPEDFLAVFVDMLLHGRESAGHLQWMTPDSFAEAAALRCGDLDCDARIMAERLRDMFGIAPDAAPLSASAPFGQWAGALHAACAGRPDVVGFRTSGSTGAPVLHTLPFAALEQEVRCVLPRLPLRRVCSVMPRYHCFGFVFGVLMPRLTGAPRRAFLPLPTMELTAHLRPGDALVGFPFFFDALARVGADLSGVMPLTAGSPCPPALADALLAAGADGVREIYGASELSAVGLRCITRTGEAADLPFTLLPQWERAEGGLIRRAEDGNASPAASPPDRLHWLDERHFTVLARRDKAVQVGGRNVYPDRVRGVLESHPAVDVCRVRLMRPEEGWRLKAFVVPKSPLPEEEEAMRLRAALFAWCRERLAPESVPKSITFGEALPHNAYGKDADWE